MKIERLSTLAPILNLSLPLTAPEKRGALSASSAVYLRNSRIPTWVPPPTGSHSYQSGINSFVVPERVTRIQYDVRGGGGGGGSGARIQGGGPQSQYAGGRGGNGARRTGTISVSPGDVITITVGAGGRRGTYNGTNALSGGSSSDSVNGSTVSADGGGAGGNGSVTTVGGSSRGTPGTNGVNGSPTGGANGGAGATSQALSGQFGQSGSVSISY